MADPQRPAGADTEAEVVSTVKGLLKRLKKKESGIDLDTSLYAEGIGLDSLEAAELSALLEDELGDDPFTSGEVLPETIGDIVDFYEEK
jgi:acyl carrier protein